MIMIDIETLGTRVYAAIIQIAAVAFDHEKALDSINLHIDLESAMKYGITEAGTLRFWSSQPEAMAKTFNYDDGMTMEEALVRLTAFVEAHPGTVWAHGASFDIPLLAYKYDRLGQQAPWNFRDVRDTRTLFEVKGYLYTKPGSHDALEDAMAQAAAVRAALNA